MHTEQWVPACHVLGPFIPAKPREAYPLTTHFERSTRRPKSYSDISKTQYEGIDTHPLKSFSTEYGTSESRHGPRKVVKYETGLTGEEGTSHPTNCRCEPRWSVRVMQASSRFRVDSFPH